MSPLLRRLALWNIAGALLSASLLALDHSPISASAADRMNSLRAGQLLAVGGWLGSWARFAPLLAARSRRWSLLATLTTCALAAAGPVAGTLVFATIGSAGPAHGWNSVGAPALADVAILSTLGACLFESTRRPRALVSWFLALSWLGPALVGDTLADLTGSDPSSAPSTPLSELLPPMAIAFVALVGALWASRPRFGAA